MINVRREQIKKEQTKLILIREFEVYEIDFLVKIITENTQL